MLTGVPVIVHNQSAIDPNTRNSFSIGSMHAVSSLRDDADTASLCSGSTKSSIIEVFNRDSSLVQSSDLLHLPSDVRYDYTNHFKEF